MAPFFPICGASAKHWNFIYLAVLIMLSIKTISSQKDDCRFDPDIPQWPRKRLRWNFHASFSYRRRTKCKLLDPLDPLDPWTLYLSTNECNWTPPRLPIKSDTHVRRRKQPTRQLTKTLSPWKSSFSHAAPRNFDLLPNCDVGEELRSILAKKSHAMPSYTSIVQGARQQVQSNPTWSF